MINRKSFFSGSLIRMKNDWFEAKLTTEFPEKFLIQSQRNRAIRNLVVVVENHTSSSFQIFVFVFNFRIIDDFFDIEFFFDLINDIFSSFQASIICEHWIQNNFPILVKTHPVIWENRIWRFWVNCIFNSKNVNSFCS